MWVIISYTGPAKRPSATVSTTRVAVGATIRIGPPHRPGGWGVACTARSFGFQNTPDQIFIIEKRVRNAAITAAASAQSPGAEAGGE